MNVMANSVALDIVGHAASLISLGYRPVSDGAFSPCLAWPHMWGRIEPRVCQQICAETPGSTSTMAQVALLITHALIAALSKCCLISSSLRPAARACAMYQLVMLGCGALGCGALGCGALGCGALGCGALGCGALAAFGSGYVIGGWAYGSMPSRAQPASTTAVTAMTISSFTFTSPSEERLQPTPDHQR